MILLLLLLALLSLLVLAGGRFVRHDGYGTNPPPASTWPVDPRLPSRPYGYR